MYYDGGPLMNDSETRTELAESEITKINQALIQYDPAVEDEKTASLLTLSWTGTKAPFPNEYIQSEGYLDRKANYEAIFGNEENNFSVTRVINLSADNIGSDKLSIRRTKKTPWSSRLGYCCIAFWTAMIMTAASS